MKKIKEKMNEAFVKGENSIVFSSISLSIITDLEEEGWNVNIINEQYIVSK